MKLCTDFWSFLAQLEAGKKGPTAINFRPDRTARPQIARARHVLPRSGAFRTAGGTGAYGA